MSTPRQAVGEVWMQVRDYRKLARLMVIQDISHRELAAAIGWKAHSYVGRIVRGTTRNVDPVAAAKIAHVLGVAVDDLFLTKVATKSGQSKSGVAA